MFRTWHATFNNARARARAHTDEALKCSISNLSSSDSIYWTCVHFNHHFLFIKIPFSTKMWFHHINTQLWYFDLLVLQNVYFNEYHIIVTEQRSKTSKDHRVGWPLPSIPVAVRGSETYTATEDGGRWASRLHSASGSEDLRRHRSSWFHCSDWRLERTHRSSRAGATVPAAITGRRMRMESGAARSSRSLIVSPSSLFC